VDLCGSVWGGGVECDCIQFSGGEWSGVVQVDCDEGPGVLPQPQPPQPQLFNGSRTSSSPCVYMR